MTHSYRPNVKALKEMRSVGKNCLDFI